MEPDVSESVARKITTQDWVRFHELSDATLRRCNRAYFASEICRTVSWVLMGAIPIFGLLCFQWSPRDWLVFLMVGAWTGIILDALKWVFLSKQIMKWARENLELKFVSVMAEALREGRDTVPMEVHEPNPQSGQLKMGVVADFLCGATGTAIAIAIFPGNLWAAFTETALFWSVLGMVGFRVASTAWEIGEQLIPSTEDRTIRIYSGLRGVGLFLLGFLVVFIVGDENEPNFSEQQTAWWIMLATNILAILAGLFSLWGSCMIYAKLKWLKGYQGKAAGSQGLP